MPASNRPHDVRIKINGAELPQAALNDLQSVRVHDDLEAPGMFSLVLYNWDPDKLEFTWSDDRLFTPGNEVEVWLGYVDELQKVMRAEITSLEPSFQADAALTLTVRGYDHRHRLLRGSRTRSFTKMKDSEIASRIATAAGLQGKVTDSKVTHDYVLQNNQSDLEFLQDRAARIGYDVYVQDKVLYFQPRKNAAKAAVTLALGDDLTDFQPRLTTLPQVGEISVRGWDFTKKAVFVGQAQAGSESSLMGGTVSGPSLANRAFGKASLVRADLAVTTKADADQMAVGQFNAMALGLIDGEAVCYGRTDLRAGIVVSIKGAGKTFSGLYFVNTVTHSVTEGAGYRTTLSVRRNAS